MIDSKICEAINGYKDCIYKKLSSNHFEDYFFIVRKFRLKEIDSNFRIVYARFYVLNGPGGLSAEQKDCYFNLLKNNDEDNFSKIIEKLYNTPRRMRNGQDRRSLFLSFTTKLLHTKNSDIPIYDRNIATVLGNLPLQGVYGVMEEGIKNREQIFSELENRMKGLLSNDCIKELIALFRKDFSAKSFWDDSLISDIKILDSILWALYTCQNEKK